MKKRQNQVPCPICQDTPSVSRTPEPAFPEEHVMPWLAMVDFDRALFDLQASIHAAEMGGRDSHR